MQEAANAAYVHTEIALRIAKGRRRLPMRLKAASG